MIQHGVALLDPDGRISRRHHDRVPLHGIPGLDPQYTAWPVGSLEEAEQVVERPPLPGERFVATYREISDWQVAA